MDAGPTAECRRQIRKNGSAKKPGGVTFDHFGLAGRSYTSKGKE